MFARRHGALRLLENGLPNSSAPRPLPVEPEPGEIYAKPARREALSAALAGRDFARGTMLDRGDAHADRDRQDDRRAEVGRHTAHDPARAAATDALRAHRLTQAEERLSNSLGKVSDDDFVFGSAVGLPLGRTNLLRRRYYSLLERAGLPRVRFHDLRRTAATVLIGSGTHIRVIAERLGAPTRR